MGRMSGEKETEFTRVAFLCLFQYNINFKTKQNLRGFIFMSFHIVLSFGNNRVSVLVRT